MPRLNFPHRALRPGTVVTDLVYAPLETELLKQAAARKCRVADGLGDASAPGRRILRCLVRNQAQDQSDSEKPHPCRMTRRPFILGLTGSIGTGKTTTASMFADAGARTWNADQAVARVYEAGGSGEEAVRKLCPKAVPVTGRGVNKQTLKRCLAEDPDLLGKLEKAVHPLVEHDRQEFIRAAAADDERLVVVEIPLLYETGGETAVDAVAVVTAPKGAQRCRVLGRGTMNEAEFESLLRRQLPDADKTRRADFVIETNSMEATRRRVGDILGKIGEGKWQRK